MDSSLVVTLLLPTYCDKVITSLVRGGYSVANAKTLANDKTSPSVVMIINVSCKDPFSHDNFTTKHTSICKILTDSGVKYYSLVLMNDIRFIANGANFSLQKIAKPKPQVSYLKLVTPTKPTTENDQPQPK